MVSWLGPEPHAYSRWGILVTLAGIILGGALLLMLNRAAVMVEDSQPRRIQAVMANAEPQDSSEADVVPVVRSEKEARNVAFSRTVHMLKPVFGLFGFFVSIYLFEWIHFRRKEKKIRRWLDGEA